MLLVKLKRMLYATQTKITGIVHIKTLLEYFIRSEGWVLLSFCVIFEVV